MQYIEVVLPLCGLYTNALLGSLNARDWLRSKESAPTTTSMGSLRFACISMSGPPPTHDVDMVSFSVSCGQTRPDCIVLLQEEGRSIHFGIKVAEQVKTDAVEGAL